METPERLTDRDHLFAFSHGIRMTLETLGIAFDGEAMQPILKRMDAILGSPRNSLLKASDDTMDDDDWDDFRRLRKIESELCETYLREVAEASTSETEAENDEQSS